MPSLYSDRNFADFSDLTEATKIEEKRNMNVKGLSEMEEQYIKKHHKHEIKENQCTSFLIEHIKAPVHLVKFNFIPFFFCVSLGIFQFYG